MSHYAVPQGFLPARRPARPGVANLDFVELAGSASWRFASGVDETPVSALFVRDALQLTVPPGPDNPPPLEDRSPHVAAEIDAAGRELAGGAWLDSWRAIIAHAMAGHRGAPPEIDQSSWLRQWAADRAAVLGPPEFASLSKLAALQRSVRDTLDAGLAWVDARLHPWREPTGGAITSFDYELIRHTVARVAHRRQVRAAALSACAVLLPVAGRWWHRVKPAAVVCSIAAATSPNTAQGLLKDAFESGSAA